MAITNVNLMGQNPNLPYQLQTEQAKLEVARKMAEMLLNEPMRGGGVIQAGRVAVPDLAPLGELFARTRARKDLSETQEKQAKLAELFNMLQSQEVEKYNNLLFGGQESPRPSPTDVGPQPAAAPAPVDAVRYGSASPIPALQKMAAETSKGFASPQDLLKALPNATPESLARMQATQQAGGLAAPPRVTVEGNMVIVTDPAGKVLSKTPVKEYGPITSEPRTGIPGQYEKGSQEFKAIGAGVPPPERSFDEKVNTAAIKTLEEGYKTYTEGIDKLNTLAQVKYDISKTSEDKFGSVASFRNAVNKFAELLGAAKLPDTASIETIHSSLGNLMLGDIRKLAPVTTQDIVEIRNIIGTETNTKRALEKITSILERATINAMDRHEKFVYNISKKSANPDEMYNTWVPGFATAPAIPAVETPGMKKSPDKALVDQYVKQYGKPK